jgi:septal ring factor EnvC (AmiA/AmiB activator)
LEQIEDKRYLAQQQEREKQELEELKRRDQQSRERLERDRMERERMERERMEHERRERELAYHSGHHEAIDGASTPVHQAMIGHQEPSREEFATPHRIANNRHKTSHDEFTPAQRAAIDAAI